MYSKKISSADISESYHKIIRCVVKVGYLLYNESWSLQVSQLI